MRFVWLLHDLVSRHLTCIYDLIGPTSGGGGCPLCRAAGVTICACTSGRARRRHGRPARKIGIAAWPPPPAIFLAPA